MKGGELHRSLSRAACSLCRRPQTRPNFRPRCSTSIVQQASFAASPARRASLDEVPASTPLTPLPEAQALVNVGDNSVLERLRVVPASPAYFSAKPNFTDSLLELEALHRKYERLPTISASEAPRVAWKSIVEYKIMVGAEPIKVSKYHKVERVLSRLNRIHPSLMPQEVKDAMEKYKRDIQPHLNVKKKVRIDHLGRAKGIGRRKTSSAIAWLVLGDGEVLINGKTTAQMFGRMHDRESALWSLKATSRLDRYNVFAIVKGGGTTGQAEALTLAVANALMVHEPALKSVLRRAGCVARDPRRVERKKPGKLKARKMPAWVKR